VKKKAKSKAQTSPLILQSPAYPVVGHKLFDRLALELSSVVGHHLTYARLASIFGQPLSTTHHWCQVSRHPEVISFISLLERLPEAKRQTFVHGLCRDSPSLAHARLANDEVSLGWLSFITEKSRGLTILNSHSLAESGFVLTGIGHSFQTLRSGCKPHCSQQAANKRARSRQVPKRCATMSEGKRTFWPVLSKLAGGLM